MYKELCESGGIRGCGPSLSEFLKFVVGIVGEHLHCVKTNRVFYNEGIDLASPLRSNLILFQCKYIDNVHLDATGCHPVRIQTTTAVV